ncbi:MAG: phosphoenolpyruvate--protein phosphotransferase, partial [Candidatus Marithrix sp.]|nr:phosphoenolpyruvate--protein phosphotransferase [Candidatus Marithrix sp.]
MSLTLHGIGVSKGIAIGRVHVIRRDTLEITQKTLTQVDTEVARFQNAIDLARQQLEHIKDQISKNIDVAEFIDSHLLMLDDSLLTKVPIDLIYEHSCNAEWALQMQGNEIIEIFDNMDDPYLSSRKNDIEQVVIRIQRILHGDTDVVPDSMTANLANNIILADDLSPADTVLMQHQGILAFATEFGGITSHTAILARSLGIPAIVGLRKARPYIKADDTLIIDGEQGVIFVSPDEHCLHHYQNRQNEQKHFRATLGKIKSAPTVTKDGVPITLHVNIEFPEDMEAVKRVGGKGVGLYRTEFLFMNRHSPPEEGEHFDAYLKVINALQGGPVTIRTLDLGADKQISGSHTASCSSALGLRAIRLCLNNSKLFIPQLRAILRASALGQVRMMIPMITGFQELFQVFNIVAEIREELQKKSLDFDPKMPFGVMLEVPAMAICTDLIAPHVDFLSIGTNDLIQYTLAIDRGDEAVNYLYDP